MTLQQANVKPIVQKLRKSLESAVWVKCPSCDGEWTKLKPCPFFWFDERGRKDDVTHMCIDCAETVRGLMFCTRNWPLKDPDSVKIHIDWPADNLANWNDVDALDPETGKTYQERVMRWTRLVGRVQWWRFPSDMEPTLDFRLSTGRSHSQVAVMLKGEEAPMIFESTVAAWHWVKMKIEKFDGRPVVRDPSEPETFRKVR